MNIGGVSMAIANNRTQTAYSVAMLDKSMDAMKTEGDGMMKLMQSADDMNAKALQAAATGLGQNFDMSA